MLTCYFILCLDNILLIYLIINIINYLLIFILFLGNNFSSLHVYVCASLLLNWAAKIKQMDFQNIIFFLQDLPTSTWSPQDVELLLSQA